jgi:uncharacterized membrane protein
MIRLSLTIMSIYCLISHHGVALSKRIIVHHTITKIIVKTMIRLMIEWATMIRLSLTIISIYCLISHHGVALSKKITVPHIITKIIVKTMIRLMIEWATMIRLSLTIISIYCLISHHGVALSKRIMVLRFVLCNGRGYKEWNLYRDRHCRNFCQLFAIWSELIN